MYFEDLEDAMACVLSLYNDEVTSTMKESFKNNHGDIFSVFTDILNFTADFGTAKENIDFCMNIFAYQKVHSDILLLFSNRSGKKLFSDWFLQYMDTASLNLQYPKDIYDILDILTSITQKAIVDIFLYIGEKEEIIEEYKNKMNILKRGMLKEN
jgi:hypothetical protein